MTPPAGRPTPVPSTHVPPPPSAPTVEQATPQQPQLPTTPTLTSRAVPPARPQTVGPRLVEPLRPPPAAVLAGGDRRGRHTHRPPLPAESPAPHTPTRRTAGRRRGRVARGGRGRVGGGTATGPASAGLPACLASPPPTPSALGPRMEGGWPRRAPAANAEEFAPWPSLEPPARARRRRLGGAGPRSLTVCWRLWLLWPGAAAAERGKERGRAHSVGPDDALAARVERATRGSRGRGPLRQMVTTILLGDIQSDSM